MTAALSVERLCAWYGPAQALSDISIDVAKGHAIGVVGRNGAGKSTLLRSIARVHRKISGDIRLNGESIGAFRGFRVAQAGIGFVREGAPVFTHLKVKENLRLGQALARKRRCDPIPISELCVTFPALEALQDRRAGLLSGGQRQMLALATAMASRPEVLLLDEPSAGLAPEAARGVFDTIRRLCEGGLTVLIAEQNQEWLAGIAERSVILERGRLASGRVPADDGSSGNRPEEPAVVAMAQAQHVTDDDERRSK